MRKLLLLLGIFMPILAAIPIKAQVPPPSTLLPKKTGISRANPNKTPVTATVIHKKKTNTSSKPKVAALAPNTSTNANDVNIAKNNYRLKASTTTCAALEKLRTQYTSDPTLFYYLGQCYAAGNLGNGIDYSKAAAAYEKTVQLKFDPTTFFALGQLYMTGGHGLTRDANKAITYYEKTTSDNLPAQYDLGRLLISRADTTKNDLQKGIRCLETAAIRGNAEAQWFLGSAYVSGKERIPKDKIKAKYWMKLYQENTTKLR
jgi:TPR repeat protein